MLARNNGIERTLLFLTRANLFELLFGRQALCRAADHFFICGVNFFFRKCAVRRAEFFLQALFAQRFELPPADNFVFVSKPGKLFKLSVVFIFAEFVDVLIVDKYIAAFFCQQFKSRVEVFGVLAPNLCVFDCRHHGFHKSAHCEVFTTTTNFV